MTIRTDLAALARLVWGVRLRRRATRAWEQTGANPADETLADVHAIIYFADGPINMYQVQQWYAPMEKLAAQHPIAIITRGVTSALAIRAATPLPVVLLPTVHELESWLSDHAPRAVFYLNQNTRNFQMLRAREPVHVFLSHGESDKDYMASNQLKAYDYAFVAGEAARSRLRDKLVGYDVDQRTVAIGRPQMDALPPAPIQLPDDDRTVVLYAPTWEGDRPSMSYSSVVSHAPQMLAALVATGHHRVIYRPHPRTGVTDRQYLAAHKELISLLETAKRADAAAGHIVDVDSAFGWQLGAADVCVADISAVAYDWLATGKPMVLTEPLSEDARVDDSGIVDAVVTIAAADSAQVVEALNAAAAPGAIAARSALVGHYFGDTNPGASMARWLAAASAAIDERASPTSA